MKITRLKSFSCVKQNFRKANCFPTKYICGEVLHPEIANLLGLCSCRTAACAIEESAAKISNLVLKESHELRKTKIHMTGRGKVHRQKCVIHVMR